MTCCELTELLVSQGVGWRLWSRCWISSRALDRMPSCHRAPRLGNFDESTVFGLQRRWSMDMWNVRSNFVLPLQEPAHAGTCTGARSFCRFVIFGSLVLVLQMQRIFGCFCHSRAPLPYIELLMSQSSAISLVFQVRYQKLEQELPAPQLPAPPDKTNGTGTILVTSHKLQLFHWPWSFKKGVGSMPENKSAMVKSHSGQPWCACGMEFVVARRISSNQVAQGSGLEPSEWHH